jgi:hypothetical protein
MEFLQTSISYNFEAAISICMDSHFTAELIYLFSKTGQTKRALNLILSDLKDVSQAISFAKSQDDPDLWEDLLDYSMDKPKFIHGLLVEAGTSIDPIKLVRRIPSGLEIEGLRDGLTRLIREHDLQDSISQGATRVMQGEVVQDMDKLYKGRRRGIKFNIAEDDAFEKKDAAPSLNGSVNSSGLGQGKCGGCHAPFQTNGMYQAIQSCSNIRTNLLTKPQNAKLSSALLVAMSSIYRIYIQTHRALSLIQEVLNDTKTALLEPHPLSSKIPLSLLPASSVARY